MALPQVIWKGQTRLTAAEQVALAVRVIDDRHFEDVRSRAQARLGDRSKKLGPLDMSRNTLRAFVGQINRAHESPPLVSGLSAQMAAFMGDQSARVTVARYALAGGHPMPTAQMLAAIDAARYRYAAGYSGLLIGWSERARQLYFSAIAPDDLDVYYLSDDPSEPVVIHHRRRREIAGKVQDVVDVYDISNEAAPVFRVVLGTDGNKGKNVTAQAIRGEGLASGWPAQWRYAPTEKHPDGRPFHRIVVTGSTRYPFATAPLVDATLNVCTGWTHFLAGISDAGHPQRNVSNLEPVGMSSDGASQQAGIDIGPEVVMAWTIVNPDQPTEHWQDGPGFDPKVTGEALRAYEASAMSAIGLPISLESTGGEPTEQERIARDILIASTYSENRRVDGAVLQRCAAMLNGLDLGEGVPDFSETPYGVLYREEVAEAISAAQALAAQAAEVAAEKARAEAAAMTPKADGDSPDPADDHESEEAPANA